MTNSQISDTFELLGMLMELHGENPFKAKSYATASYNIYKLDKQLSELSEEEMAQIPSIGVTIREKIKTLLADGHIKQLNELIAKTPAGLFDVMKVKGLGPKKVKVIYEELGIESIGELKYACLENRLTLLKGFGEKTQDNVLKNIEFLLSNTGKFRYGDIEHEIISVQNELEEIFGKENISASGNYRRRAEILTQADFVLKIPVNEIEEVAMEKWTQVYDWSQVFSPDSIAKTNVVIIKTESNVPVVLHSAEENNFGNMLFETTGSKIFLDKFRNVVGVLTNHKTEEEIFSSAGIDFIEPELREGTNEIELAQKKMLPVLITTKDVKGVIHNHSTWSDGVNTVKEMADECIKLGYEYFCISDHSQSAFYANGLSPEKVLAQQKEIDKLNSTYADFKIFKGIEADILNDGRLDYEDDILATFDFVVASVHSNLKMTEEKAMQRVLTAIRNPYTTILGHPTGRLLLSREGYPLDHKKIIECCAENNVVIELNASPYRLDMDWRWIPYAMECGVKISINPDAHNRNGILDIYFGTLAARKGGLTKEYLFNNLSMKGMEIYLTERKNNIAR